MAYTYDDVVLEAQKAGVYENFSQGDLAAIQQNPEYGMSLLGLLKDVNNATTEEQRLLSTEMANQLRKSYGVEYAVSDTEKKTVDSTTNQGGFEYDPETDPMYDVYAKTYLREGQRATANTLAQVAAMTGGRPSSYAVTAAQQAGEYYAAQLANVIPTLRQNAYQEYLGELEAKRAIQTATQNQLTSDLAKNPVSVNTGSALSDGIKKIMLGLGYVSNNAEDAEDGSDTNGQADDYSYDITNRHGEDWVAINGIGKVTYGQLLTLVKSGRVKEIIDPITRKVTYKYTAPGDKSPAIH